MKKLLLTACCLLSCSALFSLQTDLPQISDISSKVPQELDTLNAVIGATRENLSRQEILKDEVERYQQLQARFLQNPDNNELLFQMVKSAYRISELVQTAHLQNAFSKNFLNEIEMFARVAAKRGIPRQ